MIAKAIYLDQRDWINLSKIYYKKVKDKELDELLKILIDKSEKKEIVLPLSVSHLMETLGRKDKDSRERLASFMVKLSRGYTICPYVAVMDIEVMRAVIKKLGIPLPNPKRSFIKQGISNIFGSIGDIRTSKPIPPLLKQTMLSLLESPAMLEFSMTHESFSEHVRLLNENNDLVKKLENLRKIHSKIKENKLRDKAMLVMFVRDVIAPRLAKVHIDLKLPKDAIIKAPMSEKEAREFIEGIPSAYISHALANERDKMMQRPISPNDMNDIASLAIAIPYCDIVVAENMFSSIAINLKLDKKYQTVILKNLRLLKDFLKS